jgi:hypothetical protein
VLTACYLGEVRNSEEDGTLKPRGTIRDFSRKDLLIANQEPSRMMSKLCRLRRGLECFGFMLKVHVSWCVAQAFVFSWLRSEQHSRR